MKRGSICLILCLIFSTIGCQQSGVETPPVESSAVKRVPGDLVWKQHGSRNSFSPIISGDSLLWSAQDGSLSFLSIDTGEIVDRHIIPGGIAASPQLHGSDLYFATRSGDVVAYDVAAKTERWRNKLPANSSGEPALAAGLLIVPLLPQGVCAVNTQNGEIVWLAETNGRMAAPTVDGDSIYFGTNTGFLFSFNVTNGTEQWRHNLKTPIAHRASVVNDNVVVLSEKTIFAFSKGNGVNVWNFVLPKNGSTPPVLSGNLCLVATSASQVFAVNASSGKMEMGVRGDGSIIDIIYPVGNGDVVFGSRGRTLSYLDVRSGKVVWTYTGAGWFSTSPIVSGDKIFATDNNGVIHSIVY